jgi:hypothetical protein
VDKKGRQLFTERLELLSTDNTMMQLPHIESVFNIVYISKDNGPNVCNVLAKVFEYLHHSAVMMSEELNVPAPTMVLPLTLIVYNEYGFRPVVIL